MIDFGYTLQHAREAKGLSIQQVADITRMIPQQVEDLENENFSRIAAPIYGRGFVKLYCEAVGIDPKPLVAEFMEIFNGSRAPTIRRRKTAAPKQADNPAPPAPVEEATAIIAAAEPAPAPAPTPAPIPEPAPEPVPEPVPAPIPDPILDHQASEQSGNQAIPSPSAEPFHLESVAVPPPPSPPSEPAFPSIKHSNNQTIKQSPSGPSRYAAPKPLDEPIRDSVFLQPAVWRILALAVVATLILWGVFKLAAKVWDAATIAPTDDPTVETTSPAPSSNQTIKQSNNQTIKQSPAVPRTPLPVPPIYID